MPVVIHEVRPLLALFAVGALVVACSGEAPARVGDCGGAECATGSSGSSGASGRTSGGPTTGASSGSSGGRVYPPNDLGDVGAILSIRVSSSTCGAPPGECYDAQAFTVDFTASKMTNTTCVELAGSDDAGRSSGQTQNVDTSHALTPESLTSIKEALSAVRTSSSPVVGFDGPQLILEVTTKNGTTLYAQDSGCGPQKQMIKIASGWTDLWSLLQGM